MNTKRETKAGSIGGETTDDTDIGSEDQPNCALKKMASTIYHVHSGSAKEMERWLFAGGGSITAAKLSGIYISNGNDNLRSKAALKDELVYQLSSKTEIDWNRLLNELRFEIKIDWDALETHQKYHERAEFVLYRINTWNPAKPPVFVINTADLTSSLRSELEQLPKY